MKTIIYNNHRFCKQSNGYYQGYVDGIKIRLHRYVYICEKGAIPEGYHIHHIDFDKDNNDISNLVALSPYEHLKLHGDQKTLDNYEELIWNLDTNARPKASEWHGSEEGLAWHREHYEKYKDCLYNTKTFVCECCGKEFEAIDNGHNRFCSNNCKSKWRRKSGIDNETRICKHCGKEFTTNKYSKTKYCSRKCSSSKR